MNDQQRHVFISYVREDKDIVERLCHDFDKHGVKYWLDRNDIDPGARWKDAIREAISQGDFFIACFSKAYTDRIVVKREKTYMNEELILAIEELRQYSSDRKWFIPVLLSECDVPDRSIGAGETLLDINWVSLYENWDASIQKLLNVIKPIPKNIQHLIMSLDSENEMVRLNAVKALGSIGPEASPALQPLIKALKDKHWKVRIGAAEALGSIGPVANSAVLALIEMLKGDFEQVRQSAAEALGKIGPEAIAAVPALIETLKDDRLNVSEALGNIGPIAVPALIEALKDDCDVSRRRAADALCKMGPEASAAVPALIKALKDEYEVVRWNAIEALGSIGPAAIPALKGALKDEDIHVRKNVEDTIKKIYPNKDF